MIIPIPEINIIARLRKMNNFLLLLKNSSFLNKETLIIPYNKLHLEILNILYKEGFILFFKVLKNKLTLNTSINIGLKYSFGKGSLDKLKFISKISRPVYINYKNISKISDKKFTLFLSTNKGLLTSISCKLLKIGGVAVFIC
jgi:small subunit ribosomal protein S8